MICGCTEKLSNTYLCEPLEILYSSRRFSNNLRVHMNMNRQTRFHEMFCFREYVCKKRMFNCSMPSLTTSTHGKLFYFGERKKKLTIKVTRNLFSKIAYPRSVFVDSADTRVGRVVDYTDTC